MAGSGVLLALPACLQGLSDGKQLSDWTPQLRNLKSDKGVPTPTPRYS